MANFRNFDNASTDCLRAYVCAQNITQCNFKKKYFLRSGRFVRPVGCLADSEALFYLIRTARLGRTERSAVRVKAIIASKSRIKCNKNIKNYVEAYMLPAGI